MLGMGCLIVNYKEYNGDLFDAPKDYVLAHCISVDAEMGAGIAKEFSKRLGGRKYIDKYIRPYTSNSKCVPSILKDGRVIYNLVTKNRYYQKPSYKSLTESLYSLKEQLLESSDGSVVKLAMPRIGSGLDKLTWRKVRRIIKQTFADTNFDIAVYYVK